MGLPVGTGYAHFFSLPTLPNAAVLAEVTSGWAEVVPSLAGVMPGGSEGSGLPVETAANLS